MSRPFFKMLNRETIIELCSSLECQEDLLCVLNSIKSSISENAYPFTLSQLTYFSHPENCTDNYHTFNIPKKKGGYRQISAPTKLLKSIQYSLKYLLQAFYIAPDCVYGFIPGKSIIDNAKAHVKKNYVYNTDILDFFPSISYTKIKNALLQQPFCFNNTIARTIAGLCCIETVASGHFAPKRRCVLPQGSPCSPVLSNIVCYNMDLRLEKLARSYNINYTRYADDISLSCDWNAFSDSSAFLPKFHKIISESFIINTGKTRLQKKGERQTVTGLIVCDRVNVPKEYIKDLSCLLYIWRKYGRSTAFLKYYSKYPDKGNRSHHIPLMERAIQGKLEYLRRIKGEKNATWRKLHKQFNKVKRSTVDGTDYKYLYSIPIFQFEQIIGRPIVLSQTLEGLSCSFSLSRHSDFTPIQVSASAKEKLNQALSSGKESFINSFKKRFHITYCYSDSYFWLIYKGIPRRRSHMNRVAQS